MKKIIYTLAISFALLSCGTSNMNVNKLKLGMTRSEVEKSFGKPNRVLHAQLEDRHHIENLEYIDKENGTYTLTFEDGKLIEYKLKEKRNKPNKRNHKKRDNQHNKK